jgi:hypothetical protein
VMKNLKIFSVRALKGAEVQGALHLNRSTVQQITDSADEDLRTRLLSVSAQLNKARVAFKKGRALRSYSYYCLTVQVFVPLRTSCPQS